MNYKIAIVGPREAIEGFLLLGVETLPASSTMEAVETIKSLKKQFNGIRPKDHESRYAIIFVTEDLAKNFTPEDEKFFAKDPLPAIIALPSHLGSTGYSLERLGRIIERAVGSDILK